MNQLPSVCPYCEGDLVVQNFYCRHCDTTTSGRFLPSLGGEFDEDKLPILRRLARLSPEQLQFVDAFIRCEGKLNRLEEEIKLSYPTLRSRLNDIVRDLGFTPREEGKQDVMDRRQILDDLQAGKIKAEEAARLLRGER